MKKLFALLLALALALTLLGCGSAPAQEISLYEQGMELISLMKELSGSETYLNALTGNTEIQEIISAVAGGDYSEPKEVYEISLAEDVLFNIMGLTGEEDMSDELKNYMLARAHSAVISQINASGGVEMLAASSVCTAGKTFVNHELSGSTTYLYTFENAKPAVVTFALGEDNTVSATGFFIFPDNFKANSIDEIQEFFGEVSAAVKVLKR